MRQRRKLIRYELLKELAEKAEQGVPLARLIRDNHLDISTPHLSKMIHYYEVIQQSPVKKILDSLKPAWLNNIDNIQEAPENFNYSGNFPHGEWSEK